MLTKFSPPPGRKLQCVQSAVFAAVAGGATLVLSKVRPHNPANSRLLTRDNKTLNIDTAAGKIHGHLFIFNMISFLSSMREIVAYIHIFSDAAKVPPAERWPPRPGL